MRTILTVAILALFAAVLWVGGQFRAIAALEGEKISLQQRLDLAAGPAVGSAEHTRQTRLARDRKRTRWNRIGRDLDGRNTYPYMTLGLDAEYQSMNREELIAILNEIEEAALPGRDVSRLKRHLIAMLAEKDPEYVAKRFLQPGALAKWAMQDPKIACAWLDARIAAKTIGDRRIGFELAAISALLITDPDAAGRRLTALPENKQQGILWGGLGGEWSPQDHPDTDFAAAFANLARHLPDEKYLPVLASVVSSRGERHRSSAIDKIQASLAGMEEASFHTIPYASLKDFLVRIDATPAERDACILSLAERGVFERLPEKGNGITRNDLDNLREWVGAESPDLVDRATITALENRLFHDRKHYAEWADYALRCHRLSGNDELLLPFLDANQADAHLELARSLAARLSDDQLRANYLEKLK